MGTKITYIGHATCLIEFGGVKLLTDPHFSRWTLLSPRLEPLPFKPHELPQPDCILLSHAHYDHLNISSYKFISCKVPIVAPEGLADLIGKYLPNPVIELARFSSHKLAGGIEVMALPMRHRGGRLFQLTFTASNSYLIKGAGASAFFCGDSAPGPHFREIGELGRIDVALLPIGHYRPRWLMQGRHMTPQEAVAMFEELGAKDMVPIHHGTFRLSLEPKDEPVNILKGIMRDRPDLASRIHIISAGGTVLL